MGKYRKKPIVIEATQWFKHGDHPDATCWRMTVAAKDLHCTECLKSMGKHGWVKTLEGGHIVCPDDWIITGIQGEYYPCKPDIFEATYEEV